MQVLSKVVAGRSAVVAIALVLTLAGCGGNPSPSAGNAAAMPTFSVPGGTYNSAQTVTIADTTAGAMLYCTTDGTMPTTSSPQCTQPTTISKSEFLQALAVAPGGASSPVASAGYTIDLSAAATPTFSPAGGTYTSAQMVTISDNTPNVNLFYTLDGSAPSSSSTLYTAPIAISKNETLSAIAIAPAFNNSGVASVAFTINPANTATPTISPAGGTFTTSQQVTIADATASATIHYTLDGTVPTASSPVYSGPITVSQTEAVNAIALASGLGNSAVANAIFTISVPVAPAAPPVFSPASGPISSGQAVIIIDATPGAMIYYTTDGSQPTASSKQYTAPIVVSTAETINAIAIASGSSSSAVASSAYTISVPPTAPPVISPGSGAITTAQTVTVTDATAGAAIYYTTDGSTPTTSSMQYSAPIALTTAGTETISAIAVASGNSSGAVTAIYTVSIALPTLSGTVMSGSVPVNGAQVQLYAAGQTGYGSAATPLLSEPVSTNSSGVFTLSYSCPAAPGDLVYLVATGGNTGPEPNPGLGLMTALGSCSTLTGTTPIVMNEVTTVASVYALSPFITTLPNVGTSAPDSTTGAPGNYQGLANAFKTVSNMVNLATGQAYSITPAYAANPVPYLNSSTVPQSRINTLANMLNACAGSGSCANLFSNATPSGSTMPSSTLQAVLNIAQNPGNNAAALFTLASPTGPFQPVLAAAPTDWLLALTFTGGGLGIEPGTTVNEPGGTPGGQIRNLAMAIDATGNIWVAAVNETNPTSPTTSNSLIAEFNNQGAPLTPATTLSTAKTPVVTYGGYLPGTQGAVQPDGIAIDQSGNLWIGSGMNPAMTEISPGFSVLQGALPLSATASGGIAVDSKGNVWVGVGFGLNEYSSSGTMLSPVGGWNGVSSVNSSGFENLGQLQFDSTGNLWGGDNEGGFTDLDLISQTDGTIVYDPFFPIFALYFPSVVDGSGNLYNCGSQNGPPTISVFNGNQQSQVGSYPLEDNCGDQTVMDGQGHLFLASGAGAINTSGFINEYTTAGVKINPVTAALGYTGTSSGEAPTINPDPSLETIPGINPKSSVTGAAIDGSGNLWVLNANTGHPFIAPDPIAGTPAYLASPGNVLVQFVGLAAPVVTPTSVAVKTSQLGVRP